MSCLAIKGHATRGKEVIEILEMLGGINTYRLEAVRKTCFYFIVEGEIDYDVEKAITDEYTIFTLEEFLEKFPYKVGDRVLYKTYGIYLRIKSMCWNKEKEQVFYSLDSKKLYVASEDELQPYKEETMEKEGTLVKIDLTRKLCVADEVEVILGDYEFVLKDGKTYFAKKKPQYPKTYEECAKVLLERASVRNDIGYKGDLIVTLQKLLVCRDAYWKIAGEQMGLGKLWKPDWEKADEKKYCIVNTEGNVAKWVQKTTNKILAFPTEEMRDAFYENFKDLIELVKELL